MMPDSDEWEIVRNMKTEEVLMKFKAAKARYAAETGAKHTARGVATRSEVCFININLDDLAAAAIGDAGLRDLRGIDGVVALDVLRAHDAGHDQFAHLEIDADLLLALDHEIAVRQQLRHHGGDVGLQAFLALDRTLA